MSAQPPAPASNLLLRLAFYGLVAGLALSHVFITFRGLSSAEGMEQAQMAREMARGNFFQTKVLRPRAWAQLEQAGRPAPPQAMPDITQPPLQPLLWAPIFKLLEKHQAYNPGKGGYIYLLDRAAACVGAAGLLLTFFWTHGAARRLFDDTVASVALLALAVCAPLWTLAVSGSPVALLVPLFALALRLLVAAAEAGAEGRGTTAPLVGVGLAAALMVLTQWTAVWLVLGLVLGVVFGVPGARRSSAFVLVLPLLALAGWGAWTLTRCGEVLGGAKVLFQAHLLAADPDVLQRQYGPNMPPMQAEELVRELAANWQAQLGDLLGHLGYGVPALFFLAALFHRFRRVEAQGVKLALGLVFLAVAVGMGLLGLPDGEKDDASLYPVLIPGLTVFGSAMLAVLWARLYPRATGLWAGRGYAMVAVLVSALPMLSTLPAEVRMGMSMSNKIYPHWPPYVPARVATVGRLMEPGEMVFSDAPWFVAWYADVPAAWLPVKREEFTRMSERAAAAGSPVAGVVMTPLSARVNYLHEAFGGAYSEWPDLIFRGPLLAFDRDFPTRPDFPFNVLVPLVAAPVGPQEALSLHMTFYTDRQRTARE